jgi:hypothetical protein
MKHILLSILLACTYACVHKGPPALVTHCDGLASRIIGYHSIGPINMNEKGSNSYSLDELRHPVAIGFLMTSEKYKNSFGGFIDHFPSKVKVRLMVYDSRNEIVLDVKRRLGQFTAYNTTVLPKNDFLCVMGERVDSGYLPFPRIEHSSEGLSIKEYEQYYVIPKPGFITEQGWGSFFYPLPGVRYQIKLEIIGLDPRSADYLLTLAYMEIEEA